MDNPTSNQELHLSRVVQQQQIIHGALAFGAFSIAVIFVVLHFTVFEQRGAVDNIQAGSLPLIPIVGAIVVTTSVIASLIVPSKTSQQAIEQQAKQMPTPTVNDRNALLTGWQVSNLIRAGLLEGPTILALVLFLVSGDYVLLGCAAVPLGLLAASIPNEGSANRWLDAAEAKLELARSSQS